MDLTTSEYIIVFVVCYFAELIGSTTGGGGFLIQGVLISLGVPANVAVAHDVAATSGTSLGSFSVFHKKKLIRWKVLPYLMLPILLGALVGIILLDLASPEFMEKFIGFAALTFAAYLVIAPKRFGQEERELPKHFKLKAILFSFILGVYTSFCGAGAGTLALLIFTTIFGVTFIQSLGLQSVLFLSVMILSLVSYTYLGLIHLELFLVMFFAMLLSGVTGAKLAIYIGNKWLKRILPIVILGLGSYLLMK